MWGDPGQPFGVKAVQGPRRAHVPPLGPYPLAGVRDLPFPEISGLLLPEILLKDFQSQEVFFSRRALQRNTKLRRTPGALNARLPLRALRAEEVAEREPAAVPIRPKPSHRAPGHAHFRKRALGMRSARATIKKCTAAVPSTPANMPQWEQRTLSMPSRLLQPKPGRRGSRTRAPPPRIKTCSTSSPSNTQLRQEAHLGTLL